jgi:hypothetical protein
MTKYFGTAALIIGLSTLGGARDAQATAPVVTVEHFHGLVGEAHFSSFDGCALKFVHLVGVKNRDHSTDNPPIATDDVTVEYTLADFCNGSFQLGSGSATGAILGGLQRLSIRASIPVVDTFLGNTTVDVNVTFTKTGAPEGDAENTRTRTPTSFMVVHSVSKTVTASAEGSIVVGGVNLIAGLSSDDAHIDDAKTGTVTITKP